jgi:hypothetical protein
MLLSNALPVTFLLEHGLPEEDGFPSKYLAGVMRVVVRTAGEAKAGEIWRSGRISLERFVTKDKFQDFVASNVSSQVLKMRWSKRL